MIFTNFRRVLKLVRLCKEGGVSYTRITAYILYKVLNHLSRVDVIEKYIQTIESNLLTTGQNDTSCEIENASSEEQVANNDEKKNHLTETRHLPQSALLTLREQNNKDLKSFLAKAKTKNFIWFVPNCANVWGGGHYTIFRFANYFANLYGVKNIIYIYDYDPHHHASIDLFEAELQKALPDCKLKIETKLDLLPPCHAAIATTWQSAFFVKNFDLCKKKFYFMQDYESLFYPAGSLALQANYTYSFGFYGITGGLWLKKTYESYGGEAENYIFSTDKEIFYPKQVEKVRSKVEKIFFYGRPSTERRAYELGIAALMLIAEEYPHIKIVIAGLNDLYKPSFQCELLGSLSLKETGELYRDCDIGIALSATNLSYLPVELMASGCPVVTNAGPQVEWYCKDDYNCLTAHPTSHDIFNCVKKLIESPKLREKLIVNGLKTASKTTWEKEMDKIYQYISSKI